MILNGLSFFRRRLGVDDGFILRPIGPFNFREQGRILVNSGAIDPNGSQFERALAQWAGDYLLDAPGGAFSSFH